MKTKYEADPEKNLAMVGKMDGNPRVRSPVSRVMASSTGKRSQRCQCVMVAISLTLKPVTAALIDAQKEESLVVKESKS